MTPPTEADGFQGDGIKPGWRRGESPGRPSDLDWLCSISGGQGNDGPLVKHVFSSGCAAGSEPRGHEAAWD